MRSASISALRKKRGPECVNIGVLVTTMTGVNMVKATIDVRCYDHGHSNACNGWG